MKSFHLNTKSPQKNVLASMVASKPIISAGLEPDLSHTENHVQHRITDNLSRIFK